MIRSEELRVRLRDQDEERRREAVEALADLRENGALDLLVQALGDESWRVRKTAVDAILCLGDVARVVDALIGALHADENAGLRNAAVEALIRVGEPATPVLLKRMGDPSADVRKFVIDVLGGIGDPRAVGALAAAIGDPDENVRSAAAENLGAIGGDDAVRALRANLDRDDLLLQYTSLQALARIGRGIPMEDLIPLLDKPLLRKAVYECLGHVPDLRVVDLLLDGMRDRSRANRAAAAMALVKIAGTGADLGRVVAERLRGIRGSIDVGELMEDLRTPSLHRRIGLVQILGFLGGPAAVLVLVSAAEDETVRGYAMDALAGMGAEAAGILLERYEEFQGEARAIASAVLGDLADVRAVRVLAGSLDDPMPEVRAAAAAALGKIDGIGSATLFLPLLDDPVEDVQDAAVKALAPAAAADPAILLHAFSSAEAEASPGMRANLARVLGESRGVAGADTLLLLAKDADDRVRRAALEALGRIDFARFEETFTVALTDESPEVRRVTAELWGAGYSPRAVENLGRMLQDEDLWVRCAVIRGLGESGNASALPGLRACAAASEGIELITGIEAIARLAGDASLPDLRARLGHEDPEVVKVALEQIARLDPAAGDAVAAEVIALLDHHDPEVRFAAIRFAVDHPGMDALPALTGRRSVERDSAVRGALLGALERLKR